MGRGPNLVQGNDEAAGVLEDPVVRPGGVRRCEFVAAPVVLSNEEGVQRQQAHVLIRAFICSNTFVPAGESATHPPTHPPTRVLQRKCETPPSHKVHTACQEQLVVGEGVGRVSFIRVRKSSRVPLQEGTSRRAVHLEFTLGPRSLANKPSENAPVHLPYQWAAGHTSLTERAC